MINDTIDSLIQKNIKLFRTMRKISQNELAKRIHMNAATVCKIENGLRVVRINELNTISKVLNVPMELFFQEHVVDIENATAFSYYFDAAMKLIQLKSKDNLSSELSFIVDNTDRYLKYLSEHVK